MGDNAARVVKGELGLKKTHSPSPATHSISTFTIQTLMRTIRFLPYALLVLYLFLPLSLMADGTIRISGTVVDKQREPLIGVTVMVEGTNLGTITDMDGHFYLDRKSTRLNSSHITRSRMPSSA